MFDLALLIIRNDILIDSEDLERLRYAKLRPCIMLAPLVYVYPHDVYIYTYVIMVI